MRVKVIGAALAAMTMFAAAAADEADIAAFREARFGMFIHWGLYAQPGGRWKGQTMEYIGEWVQSRFRIPNAEYSQLAKTFNPVKFNADEWAAAAKAAGMEYVVLTTKHHEGFAMFKSSASEFNVVDATPFRRDVFGELAAACRRQGLKVGLYYSQALDWHEKDAADTRMPQGGKRRTSFANHGMDWGNTWDFPDAGAKDLNLYLKAKAYPQIKELLTNYGEIFVLWFDCPYCFTPEMSKDLREYVRSLSPHTLVNSRIGNGMGDFGSMGDNQMIAAKSDFPRETPMTLNDTWGFKWDDHHWKSGYEVACALMGTLANNANLLLNIGPRPDGRFPDASSDVLAELAAWRRKTGVEIRGAKASPFAQALPWGWCTVTKGGALQFVVRRDWTNDLEVCGIRNAVKSCAVPFEMSGDILRVKLAPPDDAMPRVVKVELEGAPDVDARLRPQCGELTLLPSSAERIVPGDASGPELAVDPDLVGKTCRVTEQGAFTDWHHPGDAVVWKAYFPAAGRYRVSLVTETWAHSRPWAGDRTVEVRVGEARRTLEITKDRVLPHTVYARAETEAGSVEIPAAGEFEVSVRTVSAKPEAVYNDLMALRLTAEKGKEAACGK